MKLMTHTKYVYIVLVVIVFLSVLGCESKADKNLKNRSYSIVKEVYNFYSIYIATIADAKKYQSRNAIGGVYFASMKIKDAFRHIDQLSNYKLKNNIINLISESEINTDAEHWLDIMKKHQMEIISYCIERKDRVGILEYGMKYDHDGVISGQRRYLGGLKESDFLHVFPTFEQAPISNFDVSKKSIDEYIDLVLNESNNYEKDAHIAYFIGKISTPSRFKNNRKHDEIEKMLDYEKAALVKMGGIDPPFLVQHTPIGFGNYAVHMTHKGSGITSKVSNIKHNKVWTLCMLGQRYIDGVCIGKPIHFNWHDAMSYASAVGWRLPTRKEMEDEFPERLARGTSGVWAPRDTSHSDAPNAWVYFGDHRTTNPFTGKRCTLNYSEDHKKSAQFGVVLFFDGNINNRDINRMSAQLERQPQERQPQESEAERRINTGITEELDYVKKSINPFATQAEYEKSLDNLVKKTVQ